MKKNPPFGKREPKRASRVHGALSRMLLSLLYRMFPALRAAEFLTPPRVDVFATSERMLFTSPRMARAILQHRRPGSCTEEGGEERPPGPLWDPFGYGYPQSLN